MHRYAISDTAYDSAVIRLPWWDHTLDRLRVFERGVIIWGCNCGVWGKLHAKLCNHQVCVDRFSRHTSSTSADPQEHIILQSSVKEAVKFPCGLEVVQVHMARSSVDDDDANPPGPRELSKTWHMLQNSSQETSWTMLELYIDWCFGTFSW